jgi:hypothetical protein
MITKNQPPQYPFKDFLISANSNNWAEAGITSFGLELLYKTSWMKYYDSYQPGELINNWNISCREEKVDDEWSMLVINGYTNGNLTANKITSDGVLIKPVFMLLLSDSLKFTPRFGKITFYDRDSCILATGVNSPVTLEGCELDLRNVTLSGFNFKLNEIEPNPVNKNGIKLKYSVGFKCDTRIEVINSNGEIVKTILNGDLAPGNYEQFVMVSDLSTGIYLIRMNSGPYNSTVNMILAK